MLTRNCPRGSQGLMLVQPWSGLNKNAHWWPSFPGTGPWAGSSTSRGDSFGVEQSEKGKDHCRYLLLAGHQRISTAERVASGLGSHLPPPSPPPTAPSPSQLLTGTCRPRLTLACIQGPSSLIMSLLKSSLSFPCSRDQEYRGEPQTRLLPLTRSMSRAGGLTRHRALGCSVLS